MKKKLLVCWNSRTLVEILQPLIPKLAKDFEIVVMILDYSTPAGMFELLSFWKKQGVIKEYLITPNYQKVLKVHLFMKPAIKKLKSYKFDIWLAGSEMQVPERYIRECVLPENRISVVLWHNITYLFMYNESFVIDLLKNNEVGEILRPIKNQQLRGGLYNKSLTERIKQIRTFSDFSRKAINYIRRFFHSRQKKLCDYCDRVFFPLLLAGKTFRPGRYDCLTQIGSGRSDAIVFTDEKEALAHKTLFKSSNIYTAQYPTQGSCRCNGRKEGKPAILSPLSGFEGSGRISEKHLSLFLRDYETVLSQMNAEILHLRVHPNETGSWHIQLRDYLIKNGVNSRIVDCKRPIREIMCDYAGMAGYASAALRDGRAACDYALVVGFTGISKFQFRNPKFAFGRGEGIGWIEEDGSYDEAIFNKGKYVPPARKSVPEILKELS